MVLTITDSCSHNNGGCPKYSLCVPKTGTSRTCKCFEGFRGMEVKGVDFVCGGLVVVCVCMCVVCVLSMTDALQV